MSQYTNIDVFYTLGKVVEELVDAIHEVEGRSQQYDPEDIAEVLCDESNGLTIKTLGACEKAAYLIDMLAPNSVLELETARDDFRTLLRNAEKLVELWPDIYQNAHALETIARDRVNTYKQLTQSVYDSDMLLVQIPQEACRFSVSCDDDDNDTGYLYYGHYDPPF